MYYAPPHPAYAPDVPPPPPPPPYYGAPMPPAYYEPQGPPFVARRRDQPMHAGQGAFLPPARSPPPQGATRRVREAGALGRPAPHPRALRRRVPGPRAAFRQDPRVQRPPLRVRPRHAALPLEARAGVFERRASAPRDARAQAPRGHRRPPPQRARPRGTRILRPRRRRERAVSTRALPPRFASSTRAIDASQNRPNRRDRARAFPKFSRDDAPAGALPPARPGHRHAGRVARPRARPIGAPV